ncbi:MAG: hypothetical protein K9M07_00485 [Simkaniaceae bacterium]|nr:hypothetical protein [Simkaniaceae bacterium]
MVFIIWFQKNIFPTSYSKIPFLFWIPFIFFTGISSLLFANQVSFAPVLTIYALVSLFLSFRFRQVAAFISCVGLILLAAVFQETLFKDKVVISLFALMGTAINFLIMAWVSDEVENHLLEQVENLKHARQEEDLWKMRFNTLQHQIEREREDIEDRQCSFQEKEEQYYESSQSMKQLLSVSHSENQKLFHQNQRLIEDVSSQLQQIAYLESKNETRPLLEEIKELRQALNESRVQHYQDKLLYEQYKEEMAKSQTLKVYEEKKVDLESSEMVHLVEENMEKNASDNIYLNF